MVVTSFHVLTANAFPGDGCVIEITTAGTCLMNVIVSLIWRLGAVFVCLFVYLFVMSDKYTPG